MSRTTRPPHRLSSKKLTAAKQAARKDLRRKASILRRVGLYKPKQPRKPNLRYVKRLLKEYGDVIERQAKAIKVSRRELPELKRQGYRIQRGRVVIPAAAHEKVRIKQGRIIRSQRTLSAAIITKLVMDMGDRKRGRAVFPFSDEQRNTLIQLALQYPREFLETLQTSCANYDLRRSNPYAPLLEWQHGKLFDEFDQMYYYHTNINCALIMGITL